jgi:hypothetical protein
MAGISDDLCCLIADHFGALRGGTIDFQNNRAEDKLTHALFEAGFLKPISGDVSRFYPLERVARRAEAGLTEAGLDEQTKQKLLDAAICFAGDVEDVPVTRSWFQISGPGFELMQSMASFGYAEYQEEQFRWTDKIGASMRAAFFWNDEGRSVEDPPEDEQHALNG